MSDYLVKVISESGSLRAYACITTEMVNEAYSRLKPSALAGVMLGRALAGMSLLGGTVKQNQRLAMKFEGNGPLGKIICESDGYGHVRGTVGNRDCGFDPEIDINEQIRNSIGRAGVLTVTKDLGLKEPYSGSVHIISGEIGEDIAFYLTESEQIPSAVAVASLPSKDGNGVDVAGGYLVQAIPSHGGKVASDEANIESIASMIESLPPLTKLLELGNTPENIIHTLFAEVPYKVLEVIPLSYTCGCSHDAMRRALKIAGKAEVQSLIDGGNGALLTCQFCQKEYNFTQGELKNILNNC